MLWAFLSNLNIIKLEKKKPQRGGGGIIHTQELFAIFHCYPIYAPPQFHAWSKRRCILPGTSVWFPAGCFGEWERMQLKDHEREKKKLKWKKKGKKRIFGEKEKPGGQRTARESWLSGTTLLEQQNSHQKYMIRALLKFCLQHVASKIKTPTVPIYNSPRLGRKHHTTENTETNRRCQVSNFLAPQWAAWKICEPVFHSPNHINTQVSSNR